MKADVRDKVYLLPAPFSGPAQELAALPLRYAGLTWGTDHLALVGWLPLGRPPRNHLAARPQPRPASR
ncbi:MAG: hypothetical protein WKG07_31555 [Hymenobacter sp.]